VYSVSNLNITRRELLKYKDLILQFTFSSVLILVEYIKENLVDLIDSFVAEDEEILNDKMGDLLRKTSFALTMLYSKPQSKNTLKRYKLYIFYIYLYCG
jgi:hypothetical protein